MLLRRALILLAIRSRKHKQWHTQGHWFRLTYAASPTIVQKISNSLRSDEAVIRTVYVPILRIASARRHPLMPRFVLLRARMLSFRSYAFTLLMRALMCDVNFQLQL